MKKTEKNGKKLKIVLVILMVVLISLISFVGIYVKKNGNYSNIVKNYNLAMELDGNRTVMFKLDDSKETVTKDSEGNIVEDATEEEIQNNGYTTEEVTVNDASILTKENFEDSKQIIQKRLDEYNFEEYFIRQDKENGNIILELAENDATDTVISVLNQQGKFEIKDSSTDEVLMDNSMINKAQVMYNTTTAGTAVYLDIEFTKQGKEKLNQISNDYKTIETVTEEGTSEESTTEEDENTETTQEQKEIVMEIDGQTIITTSFDEPITNGKIQLTVGQSSTDTDTLQGYIDQAKSTATVLTTGKMPVQYTTDINKYFKANISNEIVKYSFIAAIAVVTLITLCLIVKFKSKGLISAILSIGYIALTLLVIRYTNVQISVAGIAAIAATIIMNYILQVALINNSNKKQEERKKLLNLFGKYIFGIIPVFIIAITFTFATSALLNSFGMILFWGIIIQIIYNLIFAKVFEN